MPKPETLNLNHYVPKPPTVTSAYLPSPWTTRTEAELLLTTKGLRLRIVNLSAGPLASRTPPHSTLSFLRLQQKTHETRQEKAK